VLREQGLYRREDRRGSPEIIMFRKGGSGGFFSLCVFQGKSLVHFNRRWYAREKRRIQAVEEKVEVGQICETGSGVSLSISPSV
jgi:hypothetical protein